MKLNKYLLLPIVVLILILTSSQFVHAQSEVATDTHGSIWSAVDTIDLLLISFAVLLLFIIFLLANMLHLAMLNRKDNLNEEGTKSKVPKVLMILILITCFTFHAEASSGLPEWASVGRLIIDFVIIVECIAVIALINWIKYFTGINDYNLRQRALRPERKWTLEKIWARMNKLRPMEEEAGLDTGHSYDGIKELDNATPPWFTYTFIATIIFAGIYMYRYHVAYSAPNQLEEYQLEVAEARLAQSEYLTVQGDQVDETNVMMLDASGISIGKTLFTGNCVACHGAEGQGGVGPNLTDDYWLHGGNIKDVFKVVKYGVAEKGMKAWQGDFSPNQIAQLSSYVKSIYGTNPAGAKDKQGELYDIQLDKVTDQTEGKDSISR